MHKKEKDIDGAILGKCFFDLLLQHFIVILIYIYIYKAQLAKNHGFVTMDPFVTLTIGTCTINSHVAVKGGKEPRWTERLTLQLVEVGFTTLQVSIICIY